MLIQITELHRRDAFYSDSDTVEGTVIEITPYTLVEDKGDGYYGIFTANIVKSRYNFGADTTTFYKIKYRVLFN